MAKVFLAEHECPCFPYYQFIDLLSCCGLFFVYSVESLQNAAIKRMVWSVKNCVVTVATGNRVITWTEGVHTDVTQGSMEINVIKVM